VELFVRGLMVGVNAAVNGILTALFLASMSPGIVGGIPFVFALIGGIAALITFLAATTQRGWNTWNPIVKAIIGWSTPFLPTAWPTVMLGWFLYFCNHLVNGTAGFFGPGGFYSIRRISFWFGTHLTEGGVIANSSLSRPPNAVGTGWDLGSFAIIVSMRAATLPAPATTAIFSGRPTIEHESGHNLSLGAFGTWFHFIGAVDENVPPFARGRAAYAEQLAESNVTGTTMTSTFMWT